MVFRIFAVVYVMAGAVGFFMFRRFFAERARKAVRCSCRTAASVKDIRRSGRHGRRYLLDYYDMRNEHYVVSFFTKVLPRRWFLNEIVEVYYNPANPMELSVPDDSWPLCDMHFVSAASAGIYVAVGCAVLFVHACLM